MSSPADTVRPDAGGSPPPDSPADSIDPAHSAVVGPDGVSRCGWASTDDYRHYHDTEWGFGVDSDERLFEKLCLEGFQSGLSWLTILRKRDNFREAFAGFDLDAVAGFDDADVARLLADAGIVRHRGKITAVINNAARAVEMRAEHGSLAAYFWRFATPLANAGQVPATTVDSQRLAKDLKAMGWRFVGPTTCYAFMQAMGLVNDHLPGCAFREPADRSRQIVLRRWVDPPPPSIG